MKALIGKIGDLETIRVSLGISQRKICQLLMVDPSAWTRWIQRKNSAPPHIYRALQWFLAIQEKYPALDVGFWLSAGTKTTQVEALSDDFGQFKTRAQESSRQIQDLQEQLRKTEFQLNRLHQQVFIFGAVFLSTLIAAGLLMWRFVLSTHAS